MENIVQNAAAQATSARGFVHKYGNDVDTDVIIPARYLTSSDPAELAAHCMEDIDPGFVARVRQGDIMVALDNFGCGSSREHAPIAIKAAGVSCVIARSFARIFYRNAVNIGLAILECPEAAAEIQPGAELAVDFGSGEIRDIASGRTWKAMPFPPFVRDMIDSGGLVAATRRKLAAAAAAASAGATGATGAGRSCDPSRGAASSTSKAQGGQS